MKTITPKDIKPNSIIVYGDSLGFQCTEEFAKQFTPGEIVRVEGFRQWSFQDREAVFVSSFIGMGIVQVGFYGK